MRIQYDSEVAAIRGAVEAAKQAAAQRGHRCEELVLLADCGTLVVEASPGGQIRQRRRGGWIEDGDVHCGPLAKAQSPT